MALPVDQLQLSNIFTRDKKSECQISCDPLRGRNQEQTRFKSMEPSPTIWPASDFFTWAGCCSFVSNHIESVVPYMTVLEHRPADSSAGVHFPLLQAQATPLRSTPVF